MEKEDKCLLGCLYAVNRMIDKGSSSFAVKVDEKWETIQWSEIVDWINKQFAIEERED